MEINAQQAAELLHICQAKFPREFEVVMLTWQNQKLQGALIQQQTANAPEAVTSDGHTAGQVAAPDNVTGITDALKAIGPDGNIVEPDGEKEPA